MPQSVPEDSDPNSQNPWHDPIWNQNLWPGHGHPDWPGTPGQNQPSHTGTRPDARRPWPAGRPSRCGRPRAGLVGLRAGPGRVVLGDYCTKKVETTECTVTVAFTVE